MSGLCSYCELLGPGANLLNLLDLLIRSGGSLLRSTLSFEQISCKARSSKIIMYSPLGDALKTTVPRWRLLEGKGDLQTLLF